MGQMNFTGFKMMCERDFEKSNMDGILARDFNVVPNDNDKRTDTISPGGAISFHGHKLKALNKTIGLEDDTAMKLVRVVYKNKNGVQIEDVTGGCDKDGLNVGRGLGRFSDRPFPHAACSPTSGQKWWISAKDWDNIRMPLPNQEGGM